MNIKKIKFLAVLVISTLLITNVSAATIDNIEAIDNNTVTLTTSNDVVFSAGNVEWEVKILKDINISFSAKDPENDKKVLLNLSDDLTVNTWYSLITIIGAEWNIDFEIWNYLEWIISNDDLANGEKWLEKINIVDSRSIELFFSDDIADDALEFKILSEINVDSLESEGNNILNIEIESNLQKSSSYIIMVLSLEDNTANVISFDEDLLDFDTWADLVEAVEEEEVVIAVVEEKPEVIAEWNMEDIALNSAETPDTGTASWILILVAILANGAYLLRKKFIKSK